MASKKTTGAKTPPRGKRPIGLTSALGPKATTMVVIIVMAGGIMVGAWQQMKSKPKTSPAADVRAQVAPDLQAPSKQPPAAKARTAASTSTMAASPAASATPQVPLTTIAGCLERSGDAFRLKDTSGADAPKARSWKSGFIKKGSASIDVVDASDSLGLPNRVGQRVSVTGMLVDREMQARSVRRVALSCN